MEPKKNYSLCINKQKTYGAFFERWRDQNLHKSKTNNDHIDECNTKNDISEVFDETCTKQCQLAQVK